MIGFHVFFHENKKINEIENTHTQKKETSPITIIKENYKQNVGLCLIRQSLFY